MVKAADAAVAAGFRVRLISVDFADWAAALDDTLVRSRQWEWTRVSLRRANHPVRSRWVSARHRAARAVVKAVTQHRAGIGLTTRAYARTHSELVSAILEQPFDLLYGGTVGALAATAEAARRAGRPFGLDFEDYHLSESEDADAALTHALAADVVRAALDGASFTTTASAPMARQYARDYGVAPVTVHNVVPRQVAAPHVNPPVGALPLYWFSQTVGPGRGLEEVVAAVGIAGIDAVLHLRGARGAEFVDTLRSAARQHAAKLEILLHPAAPADEMVDLCRQHPIGLSVEQPFVINHDVCVSNKVMTYLAAGMAVIATATQGHEYVARHAPGALACYPAGDAVALAKVLREWHDDRDLLARARQASWHAADTRFYWEHPLERGALIAAYEKALS